MEKFLNKKILLFIIAVVIIVSTVALIYGKYREEEKVPTEGSKDRNIQLEKKFEPKPITTGREEGGWENKEEKRE